MQDIKRVEFRERKPNTNTNICFDIQTPSLRPHLHLEGFQLYALRTLKRIQTQSSTQEETQNLCTKQSHLHKREGTKSKYKAKE